MKKFVGIGLIVLMVMSICSLAYGEQKVKGESTLSSKIERGTKNAALGWTEIPDSIVETTKEKGPIVGATVGVVEGVLNAVARTVSGVVDVTTAPIGTYDEPAVKPEMIGEEGK